jgi:ATP-dependent RNA helicase RhlE
VPEAPEDYIHRIGRTGRAEATGEAFTFMAPDERGDLAAIERAVGRPLPRVTVPDFDYNARPAAPLEVPMAQRIAEIRARKAAERARAEQKRQRRAQQGHGGHTAHGHGQPQGHGSSHGHGRSSAPGQPRHRSGGRPGGGRFRGR